MRVKMLRLLHRAAQQEGVRLRFKGTLCFLSQLTHYLASSQTEARAGRQAEGCLVMGETLQANQGPSTPWGCFPLSLG